MEKKEEIEIRHRKYDDQFKQGALQQVANGRVIPLLPRLLVLGKHYFRWSATS